MSKLPEFKPLPDIGNLSSNYMSAFNQGMNIYEALVYLQGYVQITYNSMDELIDDWNNFEQYIDENISQIANEKTQEILNKWKSDGTLNEIIAQNPLWNQKVSKTGDVMRGDLQFQANTGVYGTSASGAKVNLAKTRHVGSNNYVDIGDDDSQAVIYSNEKPVWSNNGASKDLLTEEDISNVSTQLISLLGDLEKEFDVLEARMDKFTSLEEGSTTGDAELQDIRVGVDGKTYSSAGEAVREQVSSLKEDIGCVARITHSANLIDPSKIKQGLIGYAYGDSVTNLTENELYYSIVFDETYPKGTTFVLSHELGVDYPLQRFIQFNPDTKIVSASYKVQDKGNSGLYEFTTTEDNRGVAITFGRVYKDLYVATKADYLENPKVLPYGKTEVVFLGNVGTDNLESKSVTVEKLNDDVIELINQKSDNPCDYNGGDISAFDTCVCVGDSLTEGIFNVNRTESSITYPSMSYPAYLQKITGVAVTNKGSGGRTTVTWWNTFKDDDLSGHKMAIVALGVNDFYSYGKEWTEESKEALGNIVQKLQNENKNIKIFVSTVLPAKYYPASQYENINQGIRDYVKTKNDSNVICLDLAKYGHTNDKDAYNTGHLSAYGYWRLAKDYANYISWYMNNNSEVFKEIQFIGTDLTSGY